jgi:hypothetical protein
MNEYIAIASNFKNKAQCNCVLTKCNKKEINKPPIKISIARIFTHLGDWKNQELWGPHRWLVAIFVPLFPHAPMQLGKVLTFLQGEIYYKKNQ